MAKSKFEAVLTVRPGVYSTAAGVVAFTSALILGDSFGGAVLFAGFAFYVIGDLTGDVSLRRLR